MKRTRVFQTVVMIAILWTLTGCWDAKEVQDINYVKTLGIDYVKGEYVVYAVMLDFTSVAKQEGGKPSQKASVWVSRTSGISINDAIDKLYHTSQQHMFFAHISSIIYSEAVLKQGPEVVFDLTNRYHEIRYTKWVYTTQDQMDKLLSVTPFFNESPISSILNAPMETYKQSSHITPIQFHRFIANYNELGRTTLLPSLSINKETWKENLKNHELLEIDGCMIIDHGNIRGKLTKEKLSGLRWVNPKTIRTPVSITDNENKIIATIVIRKPKVKIEHHIQEGKLTFQVQVKLSGTLNELAQSISEKQLKELAIKQIKKEIYDTYKEGIGLKADIYQLGYGLLLEDPAHWKHFFGKESFPLYRDSLNSVDVQLRINNSGKYQFRI